MDGGGR
jgi:CRISP-associated protein Cas1